MYVCVLSCPQIPRLLNYKYYELEHRIEDIWISWYIIIFETSQIGSIYLSKQDEIGIFILQNFHDIGLGQLALDELININPCERYLANVNPKNSKSIKFFEKNNFKLIQHTYELVGRKKSNETKN